VAGGHVRIVRSVREALTCSRRTLGFRAPSKAQATGAGITSIVPSGRYLVCTLRRGKASLPDRRWAMADSIYRVTEVIGTSERSWEDAAKNAVETAARTVRDLRVGEVVKLDLTIEDGHVALYRARVNISFKYETD
jgi:dodecin